jgi:hypothetical protein
MLTVLTQTPLCQLSRACVSPEETLGKMPQSARAQRLPVDIKNIFGKVS